MNYKETGKHSNIWIWFDMSRFLSAGKQWKWDQAYPEKEIKQQAPDNCRCILQEQWQVLKVIKLEPLIHLKTQKFLLEKQSVGRLHIVVTSPDKLVKDYCSFHMASIRIYGFTLQLRCIEILTLWLGDLIHENLWYIANFSRD